MTDSTLVFRPGFRLLDSDGDPVSGGSIIFYAAGTLTPLTVYSTSDLSTTALGTVVYTNAEGVPVASQGSNTAVSVYTGIAAYKILFQDGTGTTLFGGAFDNIKGALDTSTFLTTGSTSTLTIPVVSKTANYTLVAADRSKLFNANPTGANFTLTLDTAAHLGNNWSTKIRNGGTAGQVILATSDSIAFAGGSFTSRAFDIGEGCEIVCDGSGFEIVGYTPPLMASKGPAPIAIVGRVGSAPGSPTPGQRWIVSAGFSTYATGDIIEANGTSFNKYTPPTNCGWLAYVQGESLYYVFISTAWATFGSGAGLGATLPTVQKFTSGSGTYTPTAATKLIRVRMSGGGGGGGSAATNNGVAGSDSSFGSWTAKGGSLGVAGPAGLGGAGGTAGADGTGNKVLRQNGGTGFPGMTGPGGNQGIPGGAGGANPFGGAGPPGAGANSADATGLAGATNTGGGGGGAGTFATSPAGSAGGGGAGEYVEFYVSAPGATAYAVGAGGAGGAAGTRAGGAGAAGVVIIEEFYL